MALICDTGAIFALYDADDAHHQAVQAVVESELGPRFLPLILVAEIDYLLAEGLGVDATLDFLDSVQQGAFTLVAPTPADLARCRQLIEQYRDLRIGLADASIVATAERLKIQRLFTVDERHFRAIKPRDWEHFILLPTDRE